MDKQASLLGVQNNKLGTVQDSKMSVENLEHSCSVVVKDLVTSSTHDTCGDVCTFVPQKPTNISTIIINREIK